MKLLLAHSIKDIRRLLTEAKVKNKDFDSLMKIGNKYEEELEKLYDKKYKEENDSKAYRKIDKEIEKVEEAPVDKNVITALNALVNKYEPLANLDSFQKLYEDGFGFNIKVYGVDIPEVISTLYGDDFVNDHYNFSTEGAVESISEYLENTYSWIEEVYQAGRMGGHLVVVPTASPQYIEDTAEDLMELLDEAKAGKITKAELVRLKDNDFYEMESDFIPVAESLINDMGKIENEVESSKKGFEQDMSDIKYWIEDIDANNWVDLIKYIPEELQANTVDDFLKKVSALGGGKEFVKTFENELRMRYKELAEV